MSNQSASQFILNHPLMLELREKLEKEWEEKIRQDQEKVTTENTVGMLQGTITGFGPNGPVINNITADSLDIKSSVGSLINSAVN